MKRLNPIGSLLGFILTLLLFVGLGFSLWRDRGLAFSPGQVTAKSRDGIVIQGFTSHRDFEKQCSYCHEPITSDLAGKCLICHQEVSQQTQTKIGLHSQIANLNQCISCHPEHRGREFDPSKASFQQFDHTVTSFSLNYHQVNYDSTPLECTACHKDTNYSIVENQTCLDCHGNHEANFAQTHFQDFGPDCIACHDGQDRMINYDHNTTRFPLEGKHGQVKCAECHTSGDFKNTPQDCQQCHTEPSMHQGLFDQNCVNCHSAQGWVPALLDNQPFDHLGTAGFSLALHGIDYAQQAINCKTCHPNSLQSFDIQTCIDCHAQHDLPFMTDHQQQFGSSCMVCHDGVDRLSNFDHANFFPLEGKHVNAQCTDCHAGQVFRGTPTECWQCHAEPDIHAGVFGLKCYYCHSDAAWEPANLQQHVFPINHGLEDASLQLQCDACHGANYIEYTCYSCHDHQPDEIAQSHFAVGITAQDLPACATCHPDGIIVSTGQVP